LSFAQATPCRPCTLGWMRSRRWIHRAVCGPSSSSFAQYWVRQLSVSSCMLHQHPCPNPAKYGAKAGGARATRCIRASTLRRPARPLKRPSTSPHNTATPLSSIFGWSCCIEARAAPSPTWRASARTLCRTTACSGPSAAPTRCTIPAQCVFAPFIFAPVFHITYIIKYITFYNFRSICYNTCRFSTMPMPRSKRSCGRTHPPTRARSLATSARARSRASNVCLPAVRLDINGLSASFSLPFVCLPHPFVCVSPSMWRSKRPNPVTGPVEARPMCQLACKQGEKCRLCLGSIAIRPVLVLACGHYFHEVCCYTMLLYHFLHTHIYPVCTRCLQPLSTSCLLARPHSQDCAKRSALPQVTGPRRDATKACPLCCEPWCVVQYHLPASTRPAAGLASRGVLSPPSKPVEPTSTPPLSSARLVEDVGLELLELCAAPPARPPPSAWFDFSSAIMEANRMFLQPVSALAQHSALYMLYFCMPLRVWLLPLRAFELMFQLPIPPQLHRQMLFGPEFDVLSKL
jgi:hypothetical protein